MGFWILKVLQLGCRRITCRSHTIDVYKILLFKGHLLGICSYKILLVTSISLFRTYPVSVYID